MYEIKRGSPPMERKTNTKYPFSLLEPDTYFKIPASDPGAQLNKSRAPKVSSTAYAYGRRHSFKIVVRQQDDGGVNIYRTT
jgi:hypothetical protein